MFGTLQGRLPQELRLDGITDMPAANRFPRAVFLPAHNARAAIPQIAEGDGLDGDEVHREQGPLARKIHHDHIVGMISADKS